MPRRLWSQGLLAAMLLVIPAPGHAQTAAELAAGIARLQDSIKAVQELIRAERARESLSLDDSLVSDGVVLLFPSTALTEGDRSTLRAGIAAAKATLVAKYGNEAARLLEGEVTSINFRRNANRSDAYATFTDGRNANNYIGRVFDMPLKVAAVERYLLGRASQRLVLRDPVLQAFAGASFSLTPDERAFYIARRNLTVSPSSIARRCAEGSLSACRSVLDVRHPEKRFAAGDSVPRNNVPVPQGVHGSVVAVAVEIGGFKTLQAIGTNGGLDEPVAILADVAGVSPDSLLRAWSNRLSASGSAEVTPSLPFTAAVVGWCGIFLLAATRRRPR